MNENLLITTEELGDYRIKIYYDEYADCPVTSWDMAACYLFEYYDRWHHTLSRDCDWKEWFNNSNHSLEDALREMVHYFVSQKDLVNYIKTGKLADWSLVYNKSSRIWELKSFYSYCLKRREWHVVKEFDPQWIKGEDVRYEMIEEFTKDELVEILQQLANDVVIQEWGSCGYSQGDYLEGIAYITKERYAKMVDSNLPTDWKARAKQLIDREVKEIGMWAWGDVKGFILEKKVSFTKVYDDEERVDEPDVDWEEVDSCWGYYMETEELIQDVIAEHNLEQVA